MSKKDKPINLLQVLEESLRARAEARPDHVVVGPFIYDVSFDRHDLLEAQSDEKQNLAGRSHHYQQQIVIDEQIAGAMQRETLLHETLHAIFFHNGTGWDIDDAVEESIVRRLSPALYAFICDNPEVVKWVQS